MKQQQAFLSNLHSTLKKANLKDLERMNTVIIKYHFWDWIGAEHIKVMMWLLEEGSGTYTRDAISEAVAIPDRKGEPWPSLVMIPRILSNLNQIGLVFVSWAERGVRENQPFYVDTETLHRECSGSLWKGLGEVINGASYRDLEALARVFTETDLLSQPGFNLRVLAWAGMIGNRHVSEEDFQTEFADIRREVRFLHDARDASHALRWANRKGLLKIAWCEPGQGFDLDAEPLEKFGFVTGGGK
jgi:hypothetical protein